MRYTIRLALAGLGAGIALCGVVWIVAGLRGESQIERWVARYLQSVVGAHINAELEIGLLDYQAPKMVTVQNVVLRSGEAELMSIGEATLELAAIPAVGAAIVIERFDLKRPRFHVVRDAGGGLVGWGNLLKQDVLTDYDSVEPGKRASDFLRLRRAQIEDAGFTYVAGPRQPVMDVGGLDVEMGAQPEGDGALYDLSGQCVWKGVFELELDARFDIDASVLEIAELAFKGDLTAERYALFPPQVQELLRRHTVEGHISGELSGTLPISKPETAALRLAVMISDTGASYEGRTVRISSGAVEVTAGAGRVVLDSQYKFLDGQATMGGTLSLLGERSFTGRLSCQEIELGGMCEVAEGASPEIAGRLALRVDVAGAIATLPDSLSGEGTVAIRNGYLMRLPVLGKLQDVVLAGKDRPAWQRTDNADAQFGIGPRALEMREFQVASMVLAVRGSGQVFYDGTLDLLVNAGPLQKLSGMLGKVGDVVNKVADSLVAYEVSGPVADPKIEVKPLKVIPKLGTKRE